MVYRELTPLVYKYKQSLTQVYMTEMHLKQWRRDSSSFSPSLTRVEYNCIAGYLMQFQIRVSVDTSLQNLHMVYQFKIIKHEYLRSRAYICFGTFITIFFFSYRYSNLTTIEILVLLPWIHASKEFQLLKLVMGRNDKNFHKSRMNVILCFTICVNCELHE